MTDHAAIAARVRADRDHAHPCDCEHDDCIHDRAYQDAPDYGELCAAYLDLYDEVTQLRAHILEQNAELHRAVQDRAHWQTRCEAAHASEGRLMAERDALRAALANALDACRIVDAAAKEGHDRIGDLVLHMLSAVEPARAALKGTSE